MQNNDTQITQLLSTIEKKKAEIGTKPKAALRSNGLIKFKTGDHVNLNTINDTEKCVDAGAYLLGEQNLRKQAAVYLGVPHVETNIEDYLADLKVRASQILWDNENKKLAVLEQKLKDLRSEDAKTADAISSILKDLK